MPCPLLTNEFARSATSRSKHMPPQYWQRGWKKGGWIHALYGLAILPNSTQSHGVEKFIASLAATHASPTQSPEKERVLRTTDGSSTKFSALSKSCGLILSSGKMSSGIPTDRSKLSPQHWSDWATVLRLEYSARPKSEPATDENDFSSWPSARTSRGGYTRDNGDPTKERPSLEGMAKMWPTARTEDGESSGMRHSRGVADTLTAVTRIWQTPATDSFRSRGLDRKDEMGLDQQARLWRTPSDPSKRGGPQRAEKRAEGGHTVNLEDQVESWPTPTARDYRSPNSQDSQERRNQGSTRGQQLMNFVEHNSQFSPPDLPIQDGQTSSPTRRTLNPLFVEMLLGLPIGWTGFAPVETVLSHYVARSRTELSRLCSPVIVDQLSMF